ncbi:MAG: hypothetical protein ACJA0M_002632, partial [Chitinophagales bacterium]
NCAHYTCQLAPRPLLDEFVTWLQAWGMVYG